MNAFDKLMAAVSAAIAKGRPQTKRQNRKSPPLPKRARRATKASKAQYSKLQKAGVPRNSARRAARELEYRPPRGPDRDLSELTESFAPGPISAPLHVPPRLEPAQPVSVAAPDWVDGRVTERPARPVLVEVAVPTLVPAPVVRLSTTGRVARGSCKAIDAKTGRQCRLLAHPETPDAHRNERGPFTHVLQAGQVPVLRQTLDQVATASVNAEVYAGASHVRGERLPTGGQRDSQGGALSSTVAKYRKRAHAGELTSEAHPPSEKYGGGV